MVIVRHPDARVGARRRKAMSAEKERKKNEFFGGNEKLLEVRNRIIIPSSFDIKGRGITGLLENNEVEIRNGAGEMDWIRGGYGETSESGVLTIKILDPLNASDIIRTEKKGREFLIKRTLTPLQVSFVLISEAGRFLEKKGGYNYLFFIFNPDRKEEEGKLFVLEISWLSSEKRWQGSLTGENFPNKKDPGSLIFLKN
ncbi:MAG: hypothetical protein WC435_02645 [Candidatus Paceibacterota bacterium]